MQARLRLIIFHTAMFLLVSCQEAPEAMDDSNLQQINGLVIKESIYPAVVWLGNCTGTFVSHNTLVTAVHCVEKGQTDADGLVPGRVVMLPYNKKVKSLKVYANPRYGGSEGGPHDMAVVLFPDQTAPAVMAMSKVAPQKGDAITLVGYGGSIWNGEAGTKRMGTNKISSMSNGCLNSDLGRKNNQGDNVAVAPGDSGGPLFRSGRLSGVASTGDGSSSQHTNVHSDTNRKFVQNLIQKNVGVSFTGLEGQPDESSLYDLYAKLEEDSSGNTQLFAGAPSQTASVELCKTPNYFECSPDNKAGAMKLTPAGANGDRQIFALPTAFQAEADAVYSLVAKDSSGKIITGNSFAVKKNAAPVIPPQ